MNDPVEFGNGLATMIPFVKEHTPDHLLWVYRRNAALLLVCLSELLKQVHSSKPLGMSFAFYSMAVMGEVLMILIYVLTRPR